MESGAGSLTQVCFLLESGSPCEILVLGLKSWGPTSYCPLNAGGWLAATFPLGSRIHQPWIGIWLDPWVPGPAQPALSFPSSGRAPCLLSLWIAHHPVSVTVLLVLNC